MKLPTIFLNPVLLRASFFSSYDQPPGIKFAKRTVYDYELEYYTRSDGGVIINGKMTDFGRGDINIRKPGQTVQGVPPYECYILCVDLIGNTNRKSGYSFGSPEEAQEKYENPLISSFGNTGRRAVRSGGGAPFFQYGNGKKCKSRVDSAAGTPGKGMRR